MTEFGKNRKFFDSISGAVSRAKLEMSVVVDYILVHESCENVELVVSRLVLIHHFHRFRFTFEYRNKDINELSNLIELAKRNTLVDPIDR